MNVGYVVWKAVEYKRNLDKRLEQNLDRIGVFLQGEIRQSFGSAPPLPDGGAVNGLGQKVSAKKWREKHHSAPGEPPYVQTGMLRRSISFQREGTKRLLVGSTLKPQGGSTHSYAFWLEIGCPRMAARPYLRPAVKKNKRMILKMIVAK